MHLGSGGGGLTKIRKWRIEERGRGRERRVFGEEGGSS